MKSLKQLKHHEQGLINEMDRYKFVEKGFISRRGKEGATIYCCVPKSFKEGLPVGECLVKRFNKKDRVLLLFEIERPKSILKRILKRK